MPKSCYSSNYKHLAARTDYPDVMKLLVDHPSPVGQETQSTLQQTLGLTRGDVNGLPHWSPTETPRQCPSETVTLKPQFLIKQGVTMPGCSGTTWVDLVSSLRTPAFWVMELQAYILGSDLEPQFLTPNKSNSSGLPSVARRVLPAPELLQRLAKTALLNQRLSLPVSF